MADYKATTISGTSYIRAKEVIIRNVLDGIKGIAFNEEHVINVETEVVRRDIGGFFKELTTDNAGTEFRLLDINGNPDGKTQTFQGVYLTMMSLYYHLAAERDAAQSE